MRVFCDEQPDRGVRYGPAVFVVSAWGCAAACGLGRLSAGMARFALPDGLFCIAGRAVLQCRMGRFAMPNGTYCAAPVEGAVFSRRFSSAPALCRQSKRPMALLRGPDGPFVEPQRFAMLPEACRAFYWRFANF